MRSDLFRFCTAMAMLAMLLPAAPVWTQTYTIKFATIAPEGSTWMNVMREFDQELRDKTNGEVGFKIYAGGVMGDESDVLRKMRIGQIHAAGFTGLGMGSIATEVRIMDTPFFFRNYDEVDHIYEKVGGDFAERFSSNGYELLGWSEVGFVYVFSKEPIYSLEDMRRIKMWVWQGDPVAEATFKVFGLKPIPLSVIDVTTALQTNMVDGVYTSPLAAVALQWFTKVNYMMEIPLADAAGAVLISEKMYTSIPDEHRHTLNALGQHYMAKLTQLSRRDNQLAIETLKKNGIKILHPADSTALKNYYQIGSLARRELVGKYYSQDLLDKVEAALEEYRRNKQ